MFFILNSRPHQKKLKKKTPRVKLKQTVSGGLAEDARMLLNLLRDIRLGCAHKRHVQTCKRSSNVR